MRWTKLKMRVEALFAPSVSGRAELRSTRYQKTHDQEGRGYITFDGIEVASFCTLAETPKIYQKYEELKSRAGLIDAKPWARQAIAQKELAGEGIYDQYDYYCALENYCNTSIGKSLTSDCVLTRALATLDRRIGRRRLMTLNLEHEHALVRKFHEFRCLCDGIGASVAKADVNQIEI